MSIVLSMAAFALASSITPGPVNIVSLSCAARHGVRATLPHVSGATVGFTLLLVLTGLGLHEVLSQWPVLTQLIRAAGVLFLLYLAYRLAADEGRISTTELRKVPSALDGALLQWLNPKAWLACVSGMGAFVADGEVFMIGVFAAVYLVICWLSLASWAWAGASLRGHLQHAAGVRWFNRAMSALLVVCALYLLLD